jgi:hypothetical protein
MRLAFIDSISIEVIELIESSNSADLNSNYNQVWIIIIKNMEITTSKVQNEKVTQKSFAAKFRTKGEIYRFLDYDVDAYLPPADCATIYFLKDICTGERKCK